MLTKKDLEDAPMFTVFSGLKGQCAARADVTPECYGECEIHGVAGENNYDQAVYDRARELEIDPLEHGCWPVAIDVFDDDCYEVLGAGHDFDIFDAALCYLNDGGTVVKLPDTMESEYYRYYVVNLPKVVRQ